MSEPVKKYTTIQHEAPVSATVKLQGQNGADILFTVRSGATEDEAKRTLDVLASAMGYAKQKYNLAPKSSYNGNGKTAPAGAAPTCPTHGTPMKPSKHGGGFYCSQKIADDDGTGKPVYCKQKA